MSLLSPALGEWMPFRTNKHRERRAVLWSLRGWRAQGTPYAFPGCLRRMRVRLGIWALEQNYTE